MAKQGKGNQQNGQSSAKDTSARSATIAERLGSFGHVSEVIEFMGATAMDAVTGRLTPSAVSAANGSIRLLLRGHELAWKHGNAQSSGFAGKFLSDGK